LLSEEVEALGSLSFLLSLDFSLPLDFSELVEVRLAPEGERWSVA
jgi:hypothetical protein